MDFASPFTSTVDFMGPTTPYSLANPVSATSNQQLQFQASPYTNVQRGEALSQSEKRWWDENPGMHWIGNGNPTRGEVANFVKGWYDTQGFDAPKLDNTDGAIYYEFGFDGAPDQSPLANYVETPKQNLPADGGSTPVSSVGTENTYPNEPGAPGYQPQPDLTIPVINDPTVVGTDGGPGRQGDPFSGFGTPTDTDPLQGGGMPGGGGGIFGGGNGGFMLPLPVDPITAILGSILLSNGNPFGGSGSLQGTVSSAGNIASNPIGAINSSVTNLGGNIMGPTIPGQTPSTTVLPTIAFPSSSGGNGGGSSPIGPTSPGTGSNGGSVDTSNPVSILPSGSSISFPNGQVPQGSGATVTAGAPNQSPPSTSILPTGSSISFPGGNPPNQTDPATVVMGGSPPSSGPNQSPPPSTPIIPTTPSNPSGPNQSPPPSTSVIPAGNPGPSDSPNTPTNVVPTPSNPGGSVTTVVPIPTPTMPDTSVASPLDRNYYREGNQSTLDLQQLLGGMAGLYGNASGQYGQTDFSNFQNILQQFAAQNQNLTGQANQQTVDSNTALRTGNVNDVGALGGQALSYLQMLNPNQYQALNAAQSGSGALGAVNQYQTQLGNQFLQGPQYSQVNAQNGDAGLSYAQSQLGNGPSDIQKLLEQQARDQLALGGSLSNQETNQAQQAAREAWSARGLVNSPGSVGAEILNTDALSRQRLAERQAQAAAIDQQGFGQRQQGYTNALNYSGAAQNYAGMGLQGALANQNAGLQAQQQNYNLGSNLMSADYGRQQQNYSNLLGNAQLQTQAAFNPFATITSANTANQGTNQGLFNNTAGLSSGQYSNQYAEQAYNPFNAYSSDVYDTNFNAANARNIAASNNAASVAGANTAANSALANSFLKILGQYATSSCWVARSVFGADNPSWVLFRHWMLNEAPGWFRELYLSQGEETAKWLDNNPELKPGIRAWMESRIAELGKIEFIDAY